MAHPEIPHGIRPTPGQAGDPARSGASKRNARYVAAAGLALATSLVVACGDTKTVRRGVDDNAPSGGAKGGFDPSRVEGATEFSKPREGSGGSAPSASGGSTGGSSRISSFVDPAESTPRVETPATLPLPSGAVQPREAAAPVAYDTGFCKGLAMGECFTLVLQLPSPLLASSLGLTTLNIAQFSPSYRGVLSRACNEGLEVGWKHLLSDQGVGLVHKQGVLRRAHGNVKKRRCVIQTVTTEDTQPIALAANESGLAVRVVDFAIESQSRSTAPAFGRFEFKNARMAFKFRDPYAFVAGPTGAREWRPVAGFDSWNLFRQTGVFPTATKKIAFGESLAFDFNLTGSSRYFHHVFAPVLDSAMKGQGLGKLGFQLSLLKKQLAIIAAGANPVVPAVVLAGIGIDALRDLCAFEASDCRIQASAFDVASAIERTYRGSSPIPSETKATFVDSTKYVPFAVVSAVVEGMDKARYLQMVGAK